MNWWNDFSKLRENSINHNPCETWGTYSKESKTQCLQTVLIAFFPTEKRLRASDWHWHFWSAKAKEWQWNFRLFQPNSLIRKWETDWQFQTLSKKSFYRTHSTNLSRTFTLSAKQLHWDAGNKTSNSDTNPLYRKKQKTKLQTGLRQIPPHMKKKVTNDWHSNFKPF